MGFTASAECQINAFLNYFDFIKGNKGEHNEEFVVFLACLFGADGT